jgi:hypothetical protein
MPATKAATAAAIAMLVGLTGKPFPHRFILVLQNRSPDHSGARDDCDRLTQFPDVSGRGPGACANQ